MTKVNDSYRYFTYTVIFLNEKLIWKKMMIGVFAWNMLIKEFTMWKKSLVPSVSFSHLFCMDTAFFAVCIHFLILFHNINHDGDCGLSKVWYTSFPPNFLFTTRSLPLASTMLHTPTLTSFLDLCIRLHPPSASFSFWDGDCCILKHSIIFNIQHN